MSANNEIVRAEMFGVPLEFQIKTEMAGDVVQVEVSCMMPHFEYDPKGGYFRVFPAPLREGPVTEQESRALELAGWLTPPHARPKAKC